MRRLPPDVAAPPAARVPCAAAAATAAATALAALLAGCTLVTVPPAPAAAPAAWLAPLPPPSAAAGPAQLAHWWAQFDDPLVARLVADTQAANATLAEAAARIAQARAALRSAGAAQTPALDGVAALSRGRSASPPLTAGTAAVGADALWEVDLFGATAQTIAAARARVAAADAVWHDLRVTLAAETAGTYVALRACEQLVALYAQDAESQRRTRALTQAKVDAGLDAPANGALAAAAAADAGNRLVAQRAECAATVQSLAVLTGRPAADLNAQLADKRARLPQPAGLAVAAVPAAALAQRPDLAAVAAEVQAAAAEVSVARADQYPRLTLAGSIRAGRVEAGGSGASAYTWSLGPGLVLPLLDGGRRAAQVDAAQARLQAAAAQATQRLREAVREVETALTRLDAAARREADATAAADGFRRFFAAQQARWEVGVGSLLDLEEARRLALGAAAALLQVQRERVAAWIALYKATGGGWSAFDPAAAGAATTGATTIGAAAAGAMNGTTAAPAASPSAAPTPTADTRAGKPRAAGGGLSTPAPASAPGTGTAADTMTAAPTAAARLHPALPAALPLTPPPPR